MILGQEYEKQSCGWWIKLIRDKSDAAISSAIIDHVLPASLVHKISSHRRRFHLSGHLDVKNLEFAEAFELWGRSVTVQFVLPLSDKEEKSKIK